MTQHPACEFSYYVATSVRIWTAINRRPIWNELTTPVESVLSRLISTLDVADFPRFVVSRKTFTRQIQNSNPLEPSETDEETGDHKRIKK